MSIQEAIDTYLGTVRSNPHCRAALNGLRNYVDSHHLDWLSLPKEQIQAVLTSYRSSNEIILKRYKAELYRFYFWVSQQGFPSAEEIANHFRKKTLLATGDYFDPSGYFEDYGSMIDCVDLAGNLGKSDEFVALNMIKALLTLAWFGMSKKEALETKMDDVNFEYSAVHIGRLTIRNPRAMEVLRQYYDEKGMNRLDGKFYSYVPSTSFFRSTAGATISIPALTSYFASLNRALYTSGKMLSFTKVSDSAKYLATYTAFQKCGMTVPSAPMPADREALIKLLELSPDCSPYKLMVSYRAFYGWYKHFKMKKK